MSNYPKIFDITYSTFAVAYLLACQVELSLAATVAARAGFWKL